MILCSDLLLIILGMFDFQSLLGLLYEPTTYIGFSLYEFENFSAQLKRTNKKLSQSYGIMSYNNIFLLPTY